MWSPVERTTSKRGRDEQCGSEADSELLASLTDESWRRALSKEFSAPYFAAIERFLAERRQRGVRVYPPLAEVFSCFNYTPLTDVKVVLIGQDPYIREGQAHGLCFSVKPGTAVPPSLVNIYKELAVDVPGFVPPSHGYLVHWAEQGVLMLNAVLTVDEGASNSHAVPACPWSKFTDAVIALLNSGPRPLVFILWGAFAQKKAKTVNPNKHRIVQCAHPSPLSATKWWGNKSFSITNKHLAELGYSPIDWNLPKIPEVRSSKIQRTSPASSSLSTPASSQPVLPDETQLEETQPEETKHVLPNQPEETQPEETQPEETQPEETQPEETQPALPNQPEESQPEESQPEETQPEESQPEETQPVLHAGSDTTLETPSEIVLPSETPLEPALPSAPLQTDATLAAATQASAGKPLCMYGKDCYQRNPLHRQKYAHPQ